MTNTSLVTSIPLPAAPIKNMKNNRENRTQFTPEVPLKLEGKHMLPLEDNLDTYVTNNNEEKLTLGVKKIPSSYLSSNE